MAHKKGAICYLAKLIIKVNAVLQARDALNLELTYTVSTSTYKCCTVSLVRTSYVLVVRYIMIKFMEVDEIQPIMDEI